MEKKQKNSICRRLLPFLLTGLLLIAAGCRVRPYDGHITSAEVTSEEFVSESAETESTEESETAAPVSDSTDSETEDVTETSAETERTVETVTEEQTASSEEASANANLPWGENAPEIPAYSGEARITLNGGKPYFDVSVLGTECTASYGDLDTLGRCTGCEALIGRECMPTEKRGNISSVHPTAWHKDKYSFVDGESLYNRCHLIAYMFTGQNANEKNLITGTRYMNTLGMNDLENQVGDYLRTTGNHVYYRVTPVFSGDNLLADGVIMEAESIEDNGEGICFCVYAYNVQPGVEIDYATGDNRLAGEEETETAVSETETEADRIGSYVLNKKTKKFHLPDCEGIAQIREENREEYTGSRNELIRQGYKPCGGCKP